MNLETLARCLSEELGGLSFAEPVSHVYNPLEYAWGPHASYLSRYGGGPKQVVFLGMNPGPFGMTQTGVPFGEVATVQNFLKINNPVQLPLLQHPKRLIEGFSCKRSEVSGRRLWGFFQKKFGLAEVFFKNHFVLNYCPLVFLEASGRNITPNTLPAYERKALEFFCNKHLREAIKCLEPEWVIGVGAFAHKCAEHALEGLNVKVGQILHPSPASPKANKDWEGQVHSQLQALLRW